MFLAAAGLIRFPAPDASAPIRDAGFGFAGETTTGSSVPRFCPEAVCADAGLSALTNSSKARLSGSAEAERQCRFAEYGSVEEDGSAKRPQPRDRARSSQILKVDTVLLDGEYSNRQARLL
ncbi:hypothetical protein [Bradyrhizobium canariense]|uniref:hypothetical protein n=1 Tax=Bradyrhizobium canariense TaxID=255045 RepID=UPI00142FCB74|nr:hypothetical protein [Bradyrhizobium canariense]